MTAHYRISGKRLAGFAAQARRLAKVSGSLTPKQIQEVLQGVNPGGYAPFQCVFTDAVENQLCSEMPITGFSATATEANIDHIQSVAVFSPGGILELTTVYSKYSYNGVTLPPIPVEVWANYPYAWIRDNADTGYYDLLMASGGWYQSNAYTLTHSDSQSIAWYRIEKAAAESAESWTFHQ